VTFGIVFGLPRPAPLPHKPPVERAHKPWATWVPPGTPLFQGSAHIVTRLRTVSGTPVQ
jgi:hypothetical protein